MNTNKKSSLAAVYLLAMLPPLFWAGNFIISKPLLNYISPVSLSFYRWGLCTLILLPFVFSKLFTHIEVIKENIIKLIVFSLLGIVAFNCLIYVGLTKTSAINAAIVNSSMPIITLIIAMLLVGEKLTLNRLVGVFLVLLGVLWIVFKGNIHNLFNFSFEEGSIFILLGVCCWALYTVLARKWPVNIPLIILVFIISAIGSILHIPFLLIESQGLPNFQDHLNINSLLSLVYLAIFPSSLAYLLWNKAIIKIGPGKTSLFMYFMPIYSAILAMIFLGEALHTYHIYGFLLVVVGLYIAMKIPKAA